MAKICCSITLHIIFLGAKCETNAKNSINNGNEWSEKTIFISICLYVNDFFIHTCMYKGYIHKHNNYNLINFLK